MPYPFNHEGAVASAGKRLLDHSGNSWIILDEEYMVFHTVRPDWDSHSGVHSGCGCMPQGIPTAGSLQIQRIKLFKNVTSAQLLADQSSRIMFISFCTVCAILLTSRVKMTPMAGEHIRTQTRRSFLSKSCRVSWVASSSSPYCRTSSTNRPGAFANSGQVEGYRSPLLGCNSLPSLLPPRHERPEPGCWSVA